MRHVKCFCVWTVLATLWTFLGVRVGQDFEYQTDFSGYKSFDWAAVPRENKGDSTSGSPFISKRIQAAVEGFLVKNGYLKSPDGKADFLVATRLTVVKKVEVDRSWDGGPGFNLSASPQESADTINKWVSEILKQYPPKAAAAPQAPAGCSTPPKQVGTAAPQV